MKLIFNAVICFALTFAMTHAAHAQNAAGLRWQPLYEPGSGGAMVALTISPHDSNRLIVSGDMLGLGLSTDRAESWQATHGFKTWEMADVTWHPTNPNIVWCGSMSGPYQSRDGGRNWVQKRRGMLPEKPIGYSAPVEIVLFDPKNVHRLLAFHGSSRHWEGPGEKPWGIVWQSTDGGEIWTRLTTITKDGSSHAPDAKGVNITWAQYAPDGSTLYATADDARFLVSTDGGKSWIQRNNGLPPGGVGRVAVHPTNPKVLWIGVDNHLPPNAKERVPGGIYKSIDGGLNWTNSSQGLGQLVTRDDANLSSRYFAVAVAASNPNVLYCNDSAWSTGVVYKSEDGGANWSAVASKSNIGHDANDAKKQKVFQIETADAAGLGMTRMIVDPKNQNIAYGFNSAFIIRTLDGGKSWNDATAQKIGNAWRGRGYEGWVSTNIAFDPWNRNHALWQAMDMGRGWVSWDNLKSWTYSLYDPQPWGGGRDAVFTRNNRIYVTTGQHGAFQGIGRSDDDGKSWKMFYGAKHGLPETGWGKSHTEPGGIYAMPDQPDRVWAVVGRRLMHSTNGGENWAPIELNDAVEWIAADPKRPSRFYVSGDKGVYRTDDGSTFGPIAGPRRAGRMAVNGLGRLYLAAAEGERGGLWRWDGKTWTRLWDEYWIYDVAVDPTNPKRLAVTTNQNPYSENSRATGVYLSGDGGKTWSSHNAGLAMLRGYAIEFNPHDSEQLIFGSNGRGFFQTRWPKTFVPTGSKTYAHNADDTRFAQVSAPATPASVQSTLGADGVTHIVRDFGGATFDYAYGADWKVGQNITSGEDGQIGYVQINSTENGGAGMVLNGVNLTPQKQTHIAVRARLLPGNKATRLNVNLNRADADGGGKTVSLELSNLKENEWHTLLEALPEGNWSRVQQIQFQGTNWGAGALPLKIQIDSLGTTSSDAKANEAARQAAPSDPTSGAAPKDKPSVAGWGFWPNFPQAWQATHRGFLERTRQDKQNKINIVFLGDSITQGWGGEGKEIWEKHFAPLGAVNYGIGGDTTRQILWRIQNGEIDGLNPKLVVLKIGTNNLYSDNNSGSDEEIAEGITKIVQTIRAKLPTTKVLLLGILPRQNDYFSGRAKNINALISKLDNGKTMHYLDMSAKFQTELGKVVPELYTADQLHLAKPGYQMWADSMQPLFEQMIK